MTPHYEFFVYIATNGSRTLYIGITNDIERRMDEHRHQLGSRFTTRYRIDRLVYVESFANVGEAIGREKQIKGWRRARKVALIESVNPRWKDLSR